MKALKRTRAGTTSVHKFGGAALANAQSIRLVVDLLSRMTEPRVVVTSALAGVTDSLLGIARMAAAGNPSRAHFDARALHDRHLRVIDEIDNSDSQTRRRIDASFAELGELLDAIGRSHALTAEMSDAVVSRGERISAQIVASALRASKIAATVVDAIDFLQTDGRFGDAAPDLARTEALATRSIGPILQRGEVAIVPGFIGAGVDGAVVTLGRGGSDLTATVIARAIGATEVTLWKDVSGFLTADPRIVPEARIVPKLDPREASELAYYGAKVLHPRALIPLTSTTTLRIRPFADPSALGTEIAHGRSIAGSPVRAISAMSSLALVTVAGNGMLGVPGIAARTFGALANANISVSLITQASSEHSICFTVPEHAAAAAEIELRTAFARELERAEIDSVEVQMGVATVAVVGVGMARTPGTAARVLGAIADARVNVIAIAQGSSERNISFVVTAESVPAAVRTIHSTFRLDKVGGGRTVRRYGADVILLGCGRIARELIEQISALPASERSSMRIVGIIDRSGSIFQARGMTPSKLTSIGSAKKRGGNLCALPGARTGVPIDAVRSMANHALTRPVLVDVSSGDTRDALLTAVSLGMDLVIANKIPLALDAQSARALLRDARGSGRQVLHEATVGAGLPIIDTVEKLISSGDRILTILACPSGTMGYLFSELGRGRKFSDALRSAMKLGYTEPDPREDLSGCDVARKAIILGRLLGYEGELSDVATESLVPIPARNLSLKDFLAQTHSFDEQWRDRVDKAASKREVLRYCATVTRASVRVGLVNVPQSSSLGSLSGTDNQFVFTTARYRENALVISGPGAGPAVTAAGVLNDLLRVVAS